MASSPAQDTLHKSSCCTTLLVLHVDALYSAVEGSNASAGSWSWGSIRTCYDVIIGPKTHVRRCWWCFIFLTRTSFVDVLPTRTTVAVRVLWAGLPLSLRATTTAATTTTATLFIVFIVALVGTLAKRTRLVVYAAACRWTAKLQSSSSTVGKVWNYQCE
jgi:hypothetical protein